MNQIKPPLSLYQIVVLNMGFFGIQFGWALQMANMSGIYKFLGANTSTMPLLWLAAPMTGLLVQPLLGWLSDRTWLKYLGRRRPYILAGALLTTLSLIVMPNSRHLYMAAALLWLLDGSINMTMQPFRALVADRSPPNQYTLCYSIQTFLVCLGGTLASLMPYLLIHVFGMSPSTEPGTVPDLLRVSFYIGAIVLLLTNLWTIIQTKELPYHKVSATLLRRPLVSVWQDVVAMPKVMRQLAWVQFFSWMGIFCFFIFFSLAIAEQIFGLPVNADLSHESNADLLLSQGVVVMGVCSALYTLISCFFVLLFPAITRKIGKAKVHVLAMVLGGSALISCSMVHNTPWLYLLMVGLGIAWASMITLPYSILAPSLPQDKIGFYMGLFNIFIVLSQIVVALSFGSLIKHVFHNYAMPAVVLGGVLFIIGGLCCLRIKDEEHG